MKNRFHNPSIDTREREKEREREIHITKTKQLNMRYVLPFIIMARTALSIISCAGKYGKIDHCVGPATTLSYTVCYPSCLHEADFFKFYSQYYQGYGLKNVTCKNCIVEENLVEYNLDNFYNASNLTYAILQGYPGYGKSENSRPGSSASSSSTYTDCDRAIMDVIEESWTHLLYAFFPNMTTTYMPAMVGQILGKLMQNAQFVPIRYKETALSLMESNVRVNTTNYRAIITGTIGHVNMTEVLDDIISVMRTEQYMTKGLLFASFVDIMQTSRLEAIAIYLIDEINNQVPAFLEQAVYRAREKCHGVSEDLGAENNYAACLEVCGERAGLGNFNPCVLRNLTATTQCNTFQAS